MVFYAILFQSNIERRLRMKKIELQGYRKNFIKFLSVFMVIFPWITYLNLSLLSKEESLVFSAYDGVFIDFFLKQKGLVLIIVAVVSLMWFIGERFLPEKIDNEVPLIKGNNKWLFVLSGIFVVGTVISTVLSNYQETAISGSPTVGEGVWTLLGYIIILFTFYNSFAHDYASNMMKKVLSVLASITVILTCVEWFYKPLLEIGVVQMLVAPSKYLDVVASMKASMFQNSVSLTFYNPGYYGGFVCILLPFIMSFFLQAKKMNEKVVYGAISIGLIFGVVASNTTTALYIAIIEIVVVLILQVVISDISKVKVALLVMVTAMAFVSAGAITGNSIFHVFSNANSATGEVVENRFEIEDIKMNANTLILVGKENSVEVVYVNKGLKFKDENGKVLKPSYIDNKYVFSEQEFSNLSVAVRSSTEEMEDVKLCLLIDAGYDNTIDFFLMNNGTFAGIGQNLAPIANISGVEIPNNLKSFYGIFTGRGYAWVNSLPILKDTLLIGKGPGNFAYYFKQFDYVGLLDTHKTVKQVIDKPHNAYIQYAIEVGLPAALAFFGIFVGAIIKAFKVFLKNKNMMQNNMIHMGAMVSMVGFLLYSIINDSMITVTPIACMIVGVLLASCYKIEAK